MFAMLTALMLTSLANDRLSAAQLIADLHVPSEVYWASSRASGARLCGGIPRETVSRDFDRRFGPRVLTLVDVINRSPGYDAANDNLIVTSSCLRHEGPDEDVIRPFEQSEFPKVDRALKKLETHYGVALPEAAPPK